MKITKSYLKQLIKEELQIAEQAAPATPAAAVQQPAQTGQAMQAKQPAQPAAPATTAQTGGLPQDILAALSGPVIWQVLETLKTQLYSQLGSKIGQFVVDNATEILDMAASAAGVAEQNVPPPKQLSGGRINLRANGAALAAAKAMAQKGVAAAAKKGVKIGQPR